MSAKSRKRFVDRGARRRNRAARRARVNAAVAEFMIGVHSDMCAAGKVLLERMPFLRGDRTAWPMPRDEHGRTIGRSIANSPFKAVDDPSSALGADA